MAHLFIPLFTSHPILFNKNITEHLFVADTEQGSVNYTVLEFRASCPICEKMSENSMKRKIIYEVL